MAITPGEWKTDRRHLFAKCKLSSPSSTNAIYVSLDENDPSFWQHETVRFLPYTTDDLVIMAYGKKMYRMLQSIAREQNISIEHGIDQLLTEIGSACHEKAIGRT